MYEAYGGRASFQTGEHMRTTSQKENILKKTQVFWNANPCDGQENLDQRMRFRYRKDPYLLPVLRNVARHQSVLEVGCGQGTDMIYCCQMMARGSSYLAVDYSPLSIEAARKSVSECGRGLNIVPEMMVGNAESLQFQDNSFDCVYSCGVLHHTPNTQAAIDEVFRVLKPGGQAYVLLYRTLSPKVLTAKCLRALSKLVDFSANSDRLLYQVTRRWGGPGKFFGTNFQECFGVPILRSYTKAKIRIMFSHYQIQRIIPVGTGIPFFPLNPWFDAGSNPLGYMWLIESAKPGSPKQLQADVR